MSSEPTIMLPMTRTEAQELLLAVQFYSRAAGQGTERFAVCNVIAEKLKEKLPDTKKHGPERNGKA